MCGHGERQIPQGEQAALKVPVDKHDSIALTCKLEDDTFKESIALVLSNRRTARQSDIADFTPTPRSVHFASHMHNPLKSVMYCQCDAKRQLS